MIALRQGRWPGPGATGASARALFPGQAQPWHRCENAGAGEGSSHASDHCGLGHRRGKLRLHRKFPRCRGSAGRRRAAGPGHGRWRGNRVPVVVIAGGRPGLVRLRLRLGPVLPGPDRRACQPRRGRPGIPPGRRPDPDWLSGAAGDRRAAASGQARRSTGDRRCCGPVRCGGPGALPAAARRLRRGPRCRRVPGGRPAARELAGQGGDVRGSGLDVEPG